MTREIGHRTLPWRQWLASVADPFPLACWGVLFVLGAAAAWIMRAGLADANGVPWPLSISPVPVLYSADASEAVRDLVSGRAFEIGYTLVKLALYAPLLLASRLLWPESRLGGSRPWTPVLLLALLALVMEFATVFLVPGWRCAVAQDRLAWHDTTIAIAGVIAGVLYPLLIGPLWEEVAFRGVMFNWLQHRSATFRIVFTAVLFAYSHVVGATGSMFPFAQMVSADYAGDLLFNWLPGGLLFGFARERSGGLALPLLLHMAMNAFFMAFGEVQLATGMCPG